MINKFVALPVTDGDSFYLKRGSKNILVDGGRSKNLHILIDEILKIKILEFVICTHNDIDHAGGIIGLLENWTGKIEEIWLPGTWKYRLLDLIEEPEEFLKEIVKNIIEINGKKDIEGALRYTSERRFIEFSDKNLEKNFDDLFREACKKEKRIDKKLFRYLSWEFFVLVHHSFEDKSPSKYQWKILKTSIEIASRIRDIALLSYKRNIKIRWFEFNGNCKGSGGEKGVLEPVNSDEIGLKSIQITALYYLHLTKFNQESLVFYAPETMTELGVLFTADSDLNFSLPLSSPKNSLIVTAPHHGSETNRCAYKQVESWHENSKIVSWVRSSKKSNSFPGKTFLSVSGQQFCTVCRPAEYRKHQALELYSIGKPQNQWVPSPSTKYCNCS